MGGALQNEASGAEMRRTFGRYRLYDVIAAGGMATVHYGRLHGELGFARTVAIKRMHRDYARDPEFVAMFMDEARLTMRVQHPNVVRTLDVVAAEGEVLLVMEYVPAVSLAQLLRAASERAKRVPPGVAAALMGDVLRGLHAAHEATDEAGNPLDIVHRDVSPQNILVGGDGSARVLDFGVAKATGRQQTTREGQVKGKFAYMAPEQITNVCVTRQSDVFAASIVLWEVLTGRRLFEAESETALLARVLSAPIEPPSAAGAGLDEALDRVVLRGLARDLGARYTSAHDMARDLEAHATPQRASVLAEWVESLAGEELARRAARVAEIENESRSDRVSVTTVLAAASGDAEPAAEEAATLRDAARARARGRLLATTAAGALVAALVAGAVAAVRLASTRAGAVSRPASAESAPSLPSAPSQAGASPGGGSRPAETPGGGLAETASARPVSARNASSAAASAASPARPAPGVTARRASPEGTAAARGPCDPPYFVDSGGHLVYRPECFR